MKSKTHFQLLIISILFPILLGSCKSIETKPLSPPKVGFDTLITRNGITLDFSSTSNLFTNESKEKFIQMFFEIYPELMRDFNPKAPSRVVFKVTETYDGIAATDGSSVTYNPQWFIKNPYDYDVVTHELMHVIQSYPKYDPWWLVEGIADYVRGVYGKYNREAGWEFTPYAAGQNFDNGYRITGRFLLWASARHKTLVPKLDAALRDDTYKPELWQTITGKTVEALWADYTADPEI